MAKVTDQSVHTGNTVYIMIQGQVLGRAQSLSGERSFGTEGVYEIGSIMPQEHVYLKYTGSVTLEHMRLRTSSLGSLGLAAMGEEVLGKGIIDINVLDNLTGNPVVTYRGCSIDTYSENFRANDIVTESVRFYYLSSDNNDINVPSQHDTALGREH